MGIRSDPLAKARPPGGNALLKGVEERAQVEVEEGHIEVLTYSWIWTLLRFLSGSAAVGEMQSSCSI